MELPAADGLVGRVPGEHGLVGVDDEVFRVREVHRVAERGDEVVIGETLRDRRARRGERKGENGGQTGDEHPASPAGGVHSWKATEPTPPIRGGSSAAGYAVGIQASGLMVTKSLILTPDRLTVTRFLPSTSDRRMGELNPVSPWPMGWRIEA